MAEPTKSQMEARRAVARGLGRPEPVARWEAVRYFEAAGLGPAAEKVEAFVNEEFDTWTHSETGEIVLSGNL